MKALLIDPATERTQEIEVRPGDWEAIQTVVGGIFDYFVLRRDSGEPFALVYCADNASHLPQPSAFAFPKAAILEDASLHFNYPIIGPGVLVSFDGNSTSAYSSAVGEAVGSIKFFAQPQQARADISYRSEAPCDEPYLPDRLWLLQQQAMLERALSSSQDRTDILSMIAGHSIRDEGEPTSPSRTSVPRAPVAARARREFIPRPVGSSASVRCSVAELEAAFLAFHEWMRKGDRAADHPILAQAFEAPPFFFPDGLDASTEEFQAGVDVEAGRLSLPFPLEAFWIVRWDFWLGGDTAGEGPALLYVEQQEKGFATVETFCERGTSFRVAPTQQHDRLRQVPCALVTALHRLNNRRYIVERDVSTPALQQVNSGRSKSKRGLAPLPAFTRVSGRVFVGRPQVSRPTGIEVCRHDRRAHWRKRRKGVELPPHEWVRVRASTIHAEKDPVPRNPYVVV